MADTETETGTEHAASGDDRPRRGLSMHEGIASWCDCCSCEAEPYWIAVAEELGIDLGSDYEDAPPATARAR